MTARAIESARDHGAAAPVTVVLPTIGRPQLIRQCLESLAHCDPPADEILVVDSSDDEAVAEVVRAFAPPARRIHCPARGLGTRSQRYAMVVEDGVVKTLNIEDAPGKADISGAENLLKGL